MTQKARDVREIPLTQIVVDDKWNGRSGDWTQKSGASDSVTNDFDSLRTSIKERGQDTPCIVRPKGKDKYALVAGFRRHLAVKLNATDADNKNPTLLCEVRDLDDLAARLANTRENTERQNLKPADVCWTLAQIQNEYTRKGIDPIQATLAADIGIDQGYVSILLQINKGLNPKFFDEWRNMSRDIPVRQVLRVAKLEKTDQAKAWENLKKNMTETSGDNEKKKKQQVMKRLVDKAHDFGFRLGQLHYAEALNADGFNFAACLDTCVDLPYKKDGSLKINENQRKRVARALEAGFDEGNREPEEDEELGEEAAE